VTRPDADYREYDPIRPGGFDWRGAAKKLWAPIVVAVALLVKFGTAGLKFGSIFIAVGGYALLWGWRFAVGFVLLILAHELGHYLEARRQGLNPSLPVFIPFLGAYVAIKDARIGPWPHAMISIAGPIAGGIAAAGVWVAGDAMDSDLLRALAYTGFLLNLFNLIPIGILDGGQIVRYYRYLKRGGAPGRARALAAMYAGVAVLLALGMFGAHVAQDRL
jgi:Zn-dependent protease